MASTETAIGIDLGTTNSCVAVFHDGRAEVIPNNFDKRTTPSMVTICKDGTRYVGEEAKDQQFKNLKNTVYESKRLIGRKFNEQCVQDRMLHWHFNVIDDNNNPKIQIKHKNEKPKEFYPEEISGMILEKMKIIAENYLGHPVNRAVVTVPAYFNDNQKQATLDAAEIAGLTVLKIMNEPTAAAFAYIIRNGINTPSNTLVFDLGGGTFDVSIIHSSGNQFTVIAVNGDPDLGGADFDILLYNEIINIIQKQMNEKVKLKNEQIRRIQAQCIRVKEQLSNSLSAEFDITNILPGVDFEYTFTRGDFEKLISHAVKKIMAIVKSTLLDAKMTIDNINNIVLVGGSSKIPIIRKNLQEFFKKDLSFAINPDEAVACGAAYQAAVLNEEKDIVVRNINVVDVVSLSLGIETEHVYMDLLIKKNTPLPATATKIYSTIMDYQTALRISVYQGEDRLTANNTHLGYFDLTGIPPAPVKVPQIHITFDINTNGVLRVTATEKSSNRTKDLEIITQTGRISKTDFIRIKRENEEYSRKQQLHNSIAEEKNALLKLCFQTQRTVQESSTLDDEEKNNFIVDVDQLTRSLEGLAVSESTLQIVRSKKIYLQRKYDNLVR